MSKVRRLRFYFFFSMVMLIIFPATFLIMPVTNMLQFRNERLVLVLVGLTFWISCIVGYTFLILAYRLDKKSPGGRKVYLFSNIPTTIADICLAAGVLAFAVISFRNMTGQYVAYIDIFIVVSAFNMHLLFSRGLHRRLIDERTENS